MNWYKKAQSTPYASWLGKQLAEHTKNYQEYYPISKYHINTIIEWIEDTNPDLSQTDLHQAITESQRWKLESLEQKETVSELKPEDIDKNKIAEILEIGFDDPTTKERGQVNPKDIQIYKVWKEEANLTGRKTEHNGTFVWIVDVIYYSPQTKMSRNHILATRNGKDFVVWE